MIPLQKAYEKYRTEGGLPLAVSSVNFIIIRLKELSLRVTGKIKYRKAAPKRMDIIYVDPSDINYTIASRCFSSNIPRYGILDGDWDLKKSKYDSTSWQSLQDRFKEGKDWPETAYYQTVVSKLNSGEEVNRLNSEKQTINSFEDYLRSLDNLYEDIVTNGYDESSVITASIGRNGNWIVNHGNHRANIVKATNVDKIPVRIKYRHKQWQDIRVKISRADAINELPTNVKQHLEHPDIQSLI